MDMIEQARLPQFTFEEICALARTNGERVDLFKNEIRLYGQGEFASGRVQTKFVQTWGSTMWHQEMPNS